VVQFYGRSLWIFVVFGPSVVGGSFIWLVPHAITKELTIDFLDGPIYGIFGLILFGHLLLSGLFLACSLSSFKGGVTCLRST